MVCQEARCIGYVAQAPFSKTEVGNVWLKGWLQAVESKGLLVSMPTKWLSSNELLWRQVDGSDPQLVKFASLCLKGWRS